MKPKLESVQTQLPEPPYPADTRAKGMKFDIDIERLEQSKTWLLAPAEVRPWLLRLWIESWKSIPCGSFEDDDDMIAARMQMPINLFQANRKVLMRGWVRHSDGLLYHPVITEFVMKIITWRNNETERKRKWREKKDANMSHGTDAGQTRDSVGLTAADDTSSTSTSTSTSVRDISPDKSGDCENSGEKTARKRADATPYEKILDLWAEILPELSQPVKLSAARKAQIRARWQDELPDLDSWRECFLHIRGSKFLMGRVDPGPGRRRFSATLDWVTKQENLLKLYEDKYHG